MPRVMKIGPGPIEPIRPDRTARTQGPGRAEPVSPTSRVDAVAASAEIQAAAEAVRAASEVRADRVAAVKAQIQSGQFQVDAAAIADAIVNGA